MTAIPTPDENLKNKPSKRKKIIIVLSLILVFVITLVSSFFIMVKIGEIRLKNSLVSSEKVQDDDSEEKFDVIYHKGKKYKYNTDLINLLLIGIDADNKDKESQGQADALYLVSVDNKKNKVKIVGISRNTMCDFGMVGIDGEVYSTKHGQICLAFAYGNDDEQSSKNCVNAVSDLLYGLPINGYYTLYLDAIEKLVDAVGGVEVNLTENDSDIEYFSQKGNKVTLKGEEVNFYIQLRGNSNAPRVERHKEFIRGFVNSAKKAIKKDLTLPVKLANEMKKYSVTDIDITSAVYLATQAVNWNIEFVNIKGEYGIEDDWETFTVDDADLKDVIIGNFYIEI